VTAAAKQFGSQINVAPANSQTALNILIWALLILAFHGAAIGIENGPLEDAQLALMLPALTLFGYAGLRGLGAVRVAGVLDRACRNAGVLARTRLQKL
jgi:hypothetical protein